MTDKTIHLKKRRSSAREDFGGPEEPIEGGEFARMSVLDLFAMVVAPGIAQRLNDPEQIAHETYRIATYLVLRSEKLKEQREQ